MAGNVIENFNAEEVVDLFWISYVYVVVLSGNIWATFLF